MNTINHKQYLNNVFQAIVSGYATPIEVLKEEFASDIKRVVFKSTQSLTQFESLFQDNFNDTIKSLENTRISALDFINEFKDKDWKIQWNEEQRLAESFDFDEFEEDFTDEAHEAIDNLFTKEAICDICEQDEFANCYFQC